MFLLRGSHDAWAVVRENKRREEREVRGMAERKEGGFGFGLRWRHGGNSAVIMFVEADIE